MSFGNVLAIISKSFKEEFQKYQKRAFMGLGSFSDNQGTIGANAFGFRWKNSSNL
jgi:hypothetical protein